jgi:ABC-type multidrug transport system ATPase subunit
MQGTGLTIVVSTPYMDEADRCGRVALIQRGRLLAVDAPAAIAASFGRPLYAIRARKRYDLLRAVRRYEHADTVFPFGDVLHYSDKRRDTDADVVGRELRAYLRAAGFDDVEVTRTAPTIEDTFMVRMGAAHGDVRPDR